MHDGGGGQESSVISLYGNIFITFVGAGILGLPYAFKEAGIIEGAIVLAFVAVLSIKAMFLVIDCKYKILSQQLDLEKLLEGDSKQDVDLEYGDVGQVALGNTGRWLVEVSLCLSQVGFCCAYAIFIPHNVVLSIPAFNYSGLLLLLLPGWIMLNLLRTLKSLAIFSLMADFATLFAYVVVFWFDFEHFDNIEKGLREESLVNLPFFLGISMYCFEGAGMILALETSVAQNLRKSFKKIFAKALTLLVILYITFGVCGYMSFGHTTMQIITLNLPDGIVPNIVRLCLSFSLFFTYPIMMFPVVKLLDKKFRSTDNLHKSNMMRVSPVLTTYVVIAIVPNFSILMAFVGATCCTLLGFILPALFHLKIFKESLTQKEKIWDIIILTIGIIGGIVCTLDALQRMFAGEIVVEDPSSTQGF